MIDLKLLSAIVNSLKEPIAFVNTDHAICFMNAAAIELYAKWGGADLIGKSVLDCHNEQSQATILEIFDEMQAGLDERLISEKPTRRIYMRAVRDSDGKLLGYFERYEYPME